MKIAVLGILNPSMTYSAWAMILSGKLPNTKITQFNITAGETLMNSHVRRYGQEHDILVRAYSTESNSDSKLMRNIALVEDSDILIGFLPHGVEKHVCFSAPAHKCGKKAIVIAH